LNEILPANPVRHCHGFVKDIKNMLFALTNGESEEKLISFPDEAVIAMKQGLN
jgi:hypothetical protein